MNKFTLKLEDTAKGFAVQIQEEGALDKTVLYQSVSHALATTYFYRAMRWIEKGKWFRLQKWNPSKANLFSEYQAIQQFVPEESDK